VSASSITAKNSAVSGDEDTVIALLLEGAATDSHFAVTGFQVTQLPTNGTLYLDSALTIPVAVGSVLPSATGSLPLYFRPSQDFNGAVDFKYVSTGTFASAGPGNADAYYLTIDGVDGGVRAEGHDGSFAVAGFTFDVEQLFDGTSGGGSGQGKAEPGPLVVDLVPGSSLTELLKNGASGKHFTLLRLEGVSVDSDGERTVYDLRLSQVFVTKVTDTNGVDHAEFSYGAISLTTTGQNEDGSAAPPHTFSWNVVSTEIGTGQLDAAVSGVIGTHLPVTSDEASVAIDVAAVNDAPAVGDITLPAIQVNSGAHLITEAQLLANAHDVDGDTLHVTSLTVEQGFGTVVDNGDHTWSYTPKINDDTDAKFAFQVSDGQLSTTGHAKMDITPVQSAPALGTPGNDTFTAVTGNSVFDAGLGVDTITFDFKLTDATVTYLDNKVIIDGPASHTVLTGFEVFNFTDGTVHNDDGNPLVDDLFYYSRYHDVWNAHLDADADYDATGWHLGRDPSFFFSTSTYLSANPDVKAAGVNPLTHFDTIGWEEGRVPSIHFDPAQYLAANPDVAAAHVDPLAHYQAFGYQEGRLPFAPSELVTANGFDYVYYLQHNPDVAAAGIDPFQHFQTIGWTEGRNPNAYFDTSGYLANYADVAAAHVNPLDHYNQFGWHEGRDPSVSFDTTSYLAAYADVNAANVNPLTHFLHFGIHEGRSSFADGVWG
jgi:type VI protein secretion system component Hcp